MITGATDGIGKAFAESLAAKEINIILISRSMNKLQMVAEHIGNIYFCIITTAINTVSIIKHK